MLRTTSRRSAPSKLRTTPAPAACDRRARWKSAAGLLALDQNAGALEEPILVFGAQGTRRGFGEHDRLRASKRLDDHRRARALVPATHRPRGGSGARKRALPQGIGSWSLLLSVLGAVAVARSAAAQGGWAIIAGGNRARSWRVVDQRAHLVAPVDVLPIADRQGRPYRMPAVSWLLRVKSGRRGAPGDSGRPGCWRRRDSHPAAPPAPPPRADARPATARCRSAPAGPTLPLRVALARQPCVPLAYRVRRASGPGAGHGRRRRPRIGRYAQNQFFRFVAQRQLDAVGLHLGDHEAVDRFALLDRRDLPPAVSRRNAVLLPSITVVPVSANCPRCIRGFACSVASAAPDGASD